MDGSSFRKGGNQPGGSSLRAVKGGGGSFSGDATSIQGTPVLPGGNPNDVLSLIGGVWTPTVVNAVELQSIQINPVAPLPGQALVFDGVQYTPTTPAGGGDVTGPGLGNSTDNAIVRWDGTTGTLIQDSLWSIDDFGDMFARADANVLPDLDNSGQIGTPLLKFRSMHAYLFSTGDLELKHPTRERAHWLIEEYEDHLQVKHVPSGRTYELVLRRKGRCSRFRPQRIFRKIVHRVLARLA
jgi:hypothetical protein